MAKNRKHKHQGKKGKSKHQGKRTTKSRGDRRAQRKAQRNMIRSIRDGTEVPQYRKERIADTRGSYGLKILSDKEVAVMRPGVEKTHDRSSRVHASYSD